MMILVPFPAIYTNNNIDGINTACDKSQDAVD